VQNECDNYCTLACTLQLQQQSQQEPTKIQKRTTTYKILYVQAEYEVLSTAMDPQAGMFNYSGLCKYTRKPLETAEKLH